MKYAIIIMVSLVSFGCEKKEIIHSNVPLPKGENGVYIGMPEEEFKKLNITYKIIFKNPNGLYDSYESDFFIPPKRVFFTFDNNLKILRGFSIRFPCQTTSEGTFNYLVKKYKNLYGSDRMYPADGSSIEGYQWRDNTVTFALIYWHIPNSCYIEKTYSLN